MAKPLATDGLWATIEPLLPPEPEKPKGGQPRIDHLAALTGILFVLDRHSLGDAAPRDGLRLRHDLPAPAAGLATSTASG